jgi:hypothetical protein
VAAKKFSPGLALSVGGHGGTLPVSGGGCNDWLSVGLPQWHFGGWEIGQKCGSSGKRQAKPDGKALIKSGRKPDPRGDWRPF